MAAVGQVLEYGARRVGGYFAGDDTVERTAALLATASVGVSFEPGLLPRGGTDQAIVTGIVTASQYGLVVTSQSLYASLARLIARDDGTRGGAMRSAAAQAVVSAGVAATGAALHQLLPQRHGEPLRRAVVRNAGRRAVMVGAAGVVVSSAAFLDAYAGNKSRSLGVLTGAAGLLVGTAFAAQRIHHFRTDDPEEDARLAPPIDPLTKADASTPATAPQPLPLPPLARSLALGTAVSAGLQGLAFAESSFARALSAGVRKVAPGSGPLAGLIGHTTAFGASIAGILAGIEYVNRRAESGGAAIDAAYTTPPKVHTVSGGPASAIEWSSLSREGVRFVNLALSRHDIAEVTGVPEDQVADPVRAFAGLASAVTEDARVDMVMEDLERLGAFERSVLCVASPTGSGYVNYVAVETLEYLTRGDCATVALQYSLRPSFLSLDRVAMGREQNRALFHALSWRLRSLPEDRRPRLVGFGESLGAHTIQDAFLNEGAAGLHRVGMERALFLGTPAGSKWAKTWRLDPDRTDPAHEVVEIGSYEELRTLPEALQASARYFLLSHHEDPITKFEPALAVQRPDWLGPSETRPTGVPKHARWYPISTFFLTLIDTKNAMDVVPGTFVARGHDYRADLARMVSVAYGLPVEDHELLRIEKALRRREADWAERRLVAEQLQRAREAVQREMSTWGLGKDGQTWPDDDTALPTFG
jgi:uncharacterized membrane protein